MPEIENILKNFSESFGSRDATTDLERAQDIAFDALEAPTSRKRIALAKKALSLSPLCVDAYIVLAREAATPDEAIALYTQAKEAGERSLGTAFEEDAGHFWGLIETRPYMRACHGLARTLWDNGKRAEAVCRYQEMLRLNPNDNQGIRYSLVDALLELGRDEEAGDLLAQYEDDGAAAWAWSEALLAFRQKGDVGDSRQALARAVETNPHVAAYLLGRKKLPHSLPDLIGLGDENEAISYVNDSSGAWTAAEGAKAWVEAALKSGLPSPDAKDAYANRVDEATLALLVLGLHAGNRVWKGFDWDVMDRLHRRGFISDPVGKAKSVVLTPKGLQAAKELHEALFVEARGAGSSSGS